MRDLGAGLLKCPEPRCPVKFGSPRVSSRGLRYLQRLQNIGCDHAFVGGSDLGGGPPSERHFWMQDRLARICRVLGYETIIEDWHTQADVYVPSRSLALEVQLRPTQFEERTIARQTKGAQPIWFIPPTTNSPTARNALFRLSAVRLEVHSRNSRKKTLNPWEDTTQNPEALLRVFGTVAKLDAKDGNLYTGRYDALDFLSEVLSGTRVWHPPGTPGLSRKTSGAWVKQEHLQFVQSRIRRTRAKAPSPTRQPRTSNTVAPSVKPKPPSNSPAPSSQHETTTTADPNRKSTAPTAVRDADLNNRTEPQEARSNHGSPRNRPQTQGPAKKQAQAHKSTPLLAEPTTIRSKQQKPRRWWMALFRRRSDK